MKVLKFFGIPSYNHLRKQSLCLFLGLTEDEEKELERLYRAGRSYVALSAETLNLFGYMSEGCYKLMCDETLVTRIAEMANYFLDLLVGKKRKTLKVSLGNIMLVDESGLKWTVPKANDLYPAG